jgi:SAM-dependent methyltransferase
VHSGSSGIRALLARPRLYELWSQIVGGEHGRSTLVREHVCPDPGARVLDLGCGPGELVRYLGDVEYVGVDVNPDYIARAKRIHSGRAEFRIGDATDLDTDFREFDVVVAFGVLHHLDDAGADKLFQGAAEALKERGRLVTVDPTLTPTQSRAARLVIVADRGRYVRTPDEYVRLAAPRFEVETVVRSDLLRIPYTHCVLECNARDNRSRHS